MDIAKRAESRENNPVRHPLIPSPSTIVAASSITRSLRSSSPAGPRCFPSAAAGPRICTQRHSPAPASGLAGCLEKWAACRVMRANQGATGSSAMVCQTLRQSGAMAGRAWRGCADVSPESSPGSRSLHKRIVDGAGVRPDPGVACRIVGAAYAPGGPSQRGLIAAWAIYLFVDAPRKKAARAFKPGCGFCEFIRRAAISTWMSADRNCSRSRL